MSETTPQYNVSESIRAQKEYCEKNQLPHFAPLSGKCWSCNNQIYSPLKGKENGGITTEKAGKELITGCPHCNRTYCD